MTNGWHYAEGGKTVGPLALNEMEAVLCTVPDPRNLRVWKVGFKDWERAGNVQELAEFIYKPPPLPQEPKLHRKPLTSQEVWRSAAAIGISVAVTLAVGGIGAALAALPLSVGLDWATRRRRQFAARVSASSAAPDPDR